MDEEKIVMSEEDLMVDYSEMSGFDFNSLDFQQIRELHQITEYDDKPYAFKFGKFDIADLFKGYLPESAEG